MKHLWEIVHPYYGSSYNDHEAVSLEDMKQHFAMLDEDMNFIYRWDWRTPDPDDYEDWEVPGDTLHVHYLMPRKDLIASIRCPISRDQEDEVHEWLTSARVLGHLKKWWAPLLDGSVK